MFRLHEDLLRSGGNRLGSMTMAAGLVAYFIEPVPDADAVQLFLFGVGVYLASALKRRGKPQPIKTTNDRRGG